MYGCTDKVGFLKPSALICIVTFLLIFRMTCASNGVYEERAVYLFEHFNKHPAKGALAYLVCVLGSTGTGKERKLTTNCQFVNRSLTAHGLDDLIAKAKATIGNLKQPNNVSTARYSEVLYKKTLRCGRVYEQESLKKLSIEGLHELVRVSLRTYWEVHKNIVHEPLAQKETPRFRLQHGSDGNSTPSESNRYDQRRSKPTGNKVNPLKIWSYRPAKFQNLPHHHYRQGTEVELSKSE